ncbi:MAG: VCBS repeat-containing protein, partial [Bryobacteraceae bacterium]
MLFGNGNGTFRQGPETQTGAGDKVSFAVADLNGDKIADLVLAGQNQNYAWGIGVSAGNGDGTFQPVVFCPAGGDIDTAYLALGDFNNDGITDVATVGSSGIWLFTGKGGGLFNPGVLVPFQGAGPDNAGYLVAGDLRKDGKLDLVVALPTGFAVLLGNGNGTFQPQQDYANPQEPGTNCGFVVGAIASGGYPAIAANCGDLDYPLLYLGNGAGGFAAPTYV